ncbi:MAG: hypothetical protein ABSE73_03405 [Planctomycetota bacterium]
MARWFVFLVWTGFILYSMDIFIPAQSRVVGTIARLFVSLGLPAYTPAKVFHWGVFLVWSPLLAGALEGGYWRRFTGRNLRLCVYGLLLFGTLTEALQYFNPARTPALLDAGLNVLGGGTGLCLRRLAGSQSEPRT